MGICFGYIACARNLLLLFELLLNYSKHDSVSSYLREGNVTCTLFWVRRLHWSNHGIAVPGAHSPIVGYET